TQSVSGDGPRTARHPVRPRRRRNRARTQRARHLQPEPEQLPHPARRGHHRGRSERATATRALGARPRRAAQRSTAGECHPAGVAVRGSAVSGIRHRLRDLPARLRSDETGSTLVLTIFYSFLALVLIFVVVAATALYLERKRLFTLADGAALVGAEAFELADVTLGSDGPEVILETRDVASAVAGYLARVPDPGFESLTLESAHTV